MNILIIDATNLLYRIYHVLRVTGGQDMVPAYMRSINKYVRDFAPDATYAVSDKRLIKGQKNYRRQQADYKQNRDCSMWETVHAAEDELEQVMQKQGIHMMYPGILEADDVIAFLCKHLTGCKTIVSTDNDMVQLIDAHTQLYSPIKKVIIDVHNCEQHLPVHVNKYLLYKSILGDASDCIKGLPGYGKVKAKRLAENYALEFSKLSAELQQQQLHNMRMMNLNQGLVEHPEERSCYLQQLEALQLISEA
jgi:DNA polymerase-1